MAPPSKKNAARERAAAARLAQQQADRRRRTLLWSAGGGVIAVIAAVIIIIVTTSGGGSSKASPSASSSASASASASASSTAQPAGLGPEGMPNEQGTVLASATHAATGETVDGIKCEASEQVAYHIHAHLAVFVNGALRPVPLGIGIVVPDVQQTKQGGFASATNCYYWLHTHVQDGVIHIESPTKSLYTLGQFFDEWKQPLSASQVGPAKGTVTAYLNGKLFTGDPRSIQLTAHAAIQLDVGSPTVAPKPVNWSTSSL